MIRTDLFQGSSVSQVVASRSPVSEASTLVSTDHQFLDTYDARASVDLFSFSVSAFENDGFSIMSPLDLSPFDQDVEVLEEDEDTQDKSCLPQAGPSSSPIQMISPLESLFPPSKLPWKHGLPEPFTPEQVRALNSCVNLRMKTC